MKYNAPFDATDDDAAYVNGNASTGTAGSIPPAEQMEYPQREIMAVIEAAGFTGTNSDLTQLLKAIRRIISNYVDPLTPKGAQQARAFTPNVVFPDFPGPSGNFKTVQSVTVVGATYLDISGYVAFRSVSSEGNDCRGRFRVSSSGASPIITDFLGCRVGLNLQIPTPLRATIKGLNPNLAYLVELIVDRETGADAVAIYDPLISILHDGNP